MSERRHTRARRLASRLRRSSGGRTRAKDRAELAYWTEKRQAEGRLGNQHYEYFYTTLFGLTRADYAGRRILDVGSGPRGSLEWATMACERVGLDPLADRYRELGTDEHGMTYVACGAERIPYPDAHFDVISTLNSLDHVDDLAAVVSELTRVARAQALLLIVVEVNHRATVTEPQPLSWDVTDRFEPHWAVRAARRCARVSGQVLIDAMHGAPYASRVPTSEPGVLVVSLVRRPGSGKARRSAEGEGFEPSMDVNRP